MPPDILPGTGEWFEAFIELGTDRQIGQVLGPIPAASIARHTAGWAMDEAACFRHVIRELDAVYLAHVNPGGDSGVEVGDNPARDAFRAAMGR